MGRGERGKVAVLCVVGRVVARCSWLVVCDGSCVLCSACNVMSDLRTFATFSIPHPHTLPRLPRLRFLSTQAHALEGLTELKSLFELNKLKPHVNRTFSLDDIAQAFTLSAGHGEGGVSNHLGKIAVNVAKT